MPAPSAQLPSVRLGRPSMFRWQKGTAGPALGVEAGEKIVLCGPHMGPVSLSVLFIIL